MNFGIHTNDNKSTTTTLCKKLSLGAKQFAEHPFDRAQLLVLDHREHQLGFGGHFYLNTGNSRLPIVAVGETPGEVYMKLAEMPVLRDYRDALRGLPMTELDKAC